MKQCKNCGAEVPDDTIVCPYCEAEFMDLAAKEHESIVKDIKENTKKVYADNAKRAKRADEIEQKGNKALGRLAKILLIAIPIALVIVAISTVLISKHKYAVRNNSIQRLEQYYAERDYEGMDKYIKKNLKNSYSATYYVYNHLLTCNFYCERYKEQKKESYDYSYLDADGRAKMLSFDIYYLFDELETVMDYREQDKAYQKDEGFLEFENFYREEARNTFCLTDEEIEEIIEGDFEVTEDYIPIAEKVIKRLGQ
ncbi:MAG: zinc ribbon domain-containing protein [Lachnospiraceae bacterium]|nr:zinc ribbon domain-containing protein [Lachnospiraceae bacterium]